MDENLLKDILNIDRLYSENKFNDINEILNRMELFGENIYVDEVFIKGLVSTLRNIINSNENVIEKVRFLNLVIESSILKHFYYSYADTPTLANRVENMYKNFMKDGVIK